MTLDTGAARAPQRPIIIDTGAAAKAKPGPKSKAAKGMARPQVASRSIAVAAGGAAGGAAFYYCNSTWGEATDWTAYLASPWLHIAAGLIVALGSKAELSYAGAGYAAGAAAAAAADYVADYEEEQAKKTTGALYEVTRPAPRLTGALMREKGGRGGIGGAAVNPWGPSPAVALLTGALLGEHAETRTRPRQGFTL